MKEENKKKTSTRKKTTSTKSTTKKQTTKKVGTTSKRTTTNKTTVKRAPIKELEQENISPVLEEKRVIEEPVKLQKDEYITPSIHVMGIIAIFLATMLVIIYGVVMFKKAKEVTYSDDWANKSYLVEQEITPQIECNKIPNAILGDRAFIFVTTYSEEEFELEKDLAKVIKENKLNNDFYVYPLTDNCGPVSNPTSVAGKNLKLESGLTKTPAILFYRNGALEEVVTREDEKMLEVGDFQKLLDIYEITK